MHNFTRTYIVMYFERDYRFNIVVGRNSPSVINVKAVKKVPLLYYPRGGNNTDTVTVSCELLEQRRQRCCDDDHSSNSWRSFDFDRYTPSLRGVIAHTLNGGFDFPKDYYYSSRDDKEFVSTLLKEPIGGVVMTPRHPFVAKIEKRFRNKTSGYWSLQLAVSNNTRFRARVASQCVDLLENNVAKKCDMIHVKNYTITNLNKKQKVVIITEFTVIK